MIIDRDLLNQPVGSQLRQEAGHAQPFVA